MVSLEFSMRLLRSYSFKIYYTKDLVIRIFLIFSLFFWISYFCTKISSDIYPHFCPLTPSHCILPSHPSPNFIYFSLFFSALFFFNKMTSQINVANTCVGMEPSSVAWATYKWLHPQQKSDSPSFSEYHNF